MLIVGGLLGASRPVPQNGVSHLKVFEDVIQLISHAYVEDVNIDKVFDGAMRGLGDGLDASSAYLMPDEVKSLEANQPLPAGDVGVVLSRQFYLRVVGVRDGSPAQRARIAEGDFVRAIDEKPTRDMSAFTGARMLRGAPGSRVKLLVFRNSAAEPHSVEVTREVIAGEPVTSRRLPGGETYVRIASFGSTTANTLRAQLPTGSADGIGPQLSASGGASRVILDIRGTADGAPEDGIAAARLFIQNGTIATRSARNAPNVVTTANPGDGVLTMPVVLLVSNGTAHAAEVFAAALSGNKRARLVGEPTAGLAGVQRLVRLPEGHGLWLTYAQYLQTDGTPIHQQGLRPHVIVETPTVDFDEAPPANDAVLERGIKELANAASPAPSPSASGAPTPAEGASGPRTREQVPTTVPR